MSMFLLSLLGANLLLTALIWVLVMKACTLVDRAKDILFLVYDWLEMLRNSKEVMENDYED